jgi:hypothetical protein
MVSFEERGAVRPRSTKGLSNRCHLARGSDARGLNPRDVALLRAIFFAFAPGLDAIASTQERIAIQSRIVSGIGTGMRRASIHRPSMS